MRNPANNKNIEVKALLGWRRS